MEINRVCIEYKIGHAQVTRMYSIEFYTHIFYCYFCIYHHHVPVCVVISNPMNIYVFSYFSRLVE